MTIELNYHFMDLWIYIMTTFSLRAPKFNVFYNYDIHLTNNSSVLLCSCIDIHELAYVEMFDFECFYSILNVKLILYEMNFRWIFRFSLYMVFVRHGLVGTYKVRLN